MELFAENTNPYFVVPSLAVETTKVVDLITGLLQNNRVTTEDIGVMAPFRRQVQKNRGLCLKQENTEQIEHKACSCN